MAEILTFPTLLTLKIMGVNHQDLVTDIATIISKYSADFNPQCDLLVKKSTKGNYLAVSAQIQAISKQQLDQICQALNQHKLVKIII